MTTLVTRTVARLAVPVILVLSVALFLQGHNQPGGGFIAGVLTAAAFALLAVAYSIEFIQTEILGQAVETGVAVLADGVVGRYRHLLAVGLALAAGSGLVPMLFPEPFRGEDGFLSQTYRILHDLPLYGELELATAVVFDLGVYLTVVGAVLTIISVVGSE